MRNRPFAYESIFSVAAAVSYLSKTPSFPGFTITLFPQKPQQLRPFNALNTHAISLISTFRGLVSSGFETIMMVCQNKTQMVQIDRLVVTAIFPVQFLACA